MSRTPRCKESIKIPVPNLAFAIKVYLTNLFTSGTVNVRRTKNNEIEFTLDGVPKEEIDEMYNQSIIPVTVNLWDILAIQ